MQSNYTKPFEDLTGKTFGRVTVVSLDHLKGGTRFWKCICLCGLDRILSKQNICNPHGCHGCKALGIIVPSDTPKMLNNYYYLKAKLADVEYDFSLPWYTYPCLDWERGAVGPKGFKYGIFRLPAPRANEPKVKAHRMAYELSKGPIPEGYDICHHCDRPICFCPAHLFAATAEENIHDMLAKGRNNHPNGERHRGAKLTENQVVEIRSLYASGKRYVDIARQFRVTRSLVYLVVTRRSWKHVIP